MTFAEMAHSCVKQAVVDPRQAARSEWALISASFKASRDLEKRGKV